LQVYIQIANQLDAVWRLFLDSRAHSYSVNQTYRFVVSLRYECKTKETEAKGAKRGQEMGIRWRASG